MDQAPKDGYYEMSPEDFNIFVERCLYYQKLFGLKTWEFYFEHDDLSEREELACVNWCLQGHSATITLSTKLPTGHQGSKEQMLDRVARHEVIHVGVARFYDYAQRRFLNPDDLDESLEEMVRFIDNIFVEGAENGLWSIE